MSDPLVRYYYRNAYLTSEHWQTLRTAKMAEVDARCKICGIRNLSNDVHHVVYRNLYGCTTDDLVVLCRRCHDEVHEALKKNPKINGAQTARNRWRRTIVSIRSYSRIEFAKQRRQELLDQMTKCKELRQQLVENGYIFHAGKCVPLHHNFFKKIRNKLTDNLPDFWYLVCRYGGLKIEWPSGEH